MLGPGQKFLFIFLGLLTFVKLIIVFQNKTSRGILKKPLLFLFWMMTWPGTEPENFLKHKKFDKKDRELILKGLLSLLTGFGLIKLISHHVLFLDILGGYIATVAFLYIFTVGYTNLVCGLYRLFGIYAEVLFDNPFESVSLKDFWSYRWNQAFVGMNRRLFYNPFEKKLNKEYLQFTIFILSGLLHDLAFCYPVDAGYGKPTVYFIIQGLAFLFENKYLKKFIENRPTLGNFWAFSVILFPAPLLFHYDFRDFLLEIIIKLNI